MLFGKIVFKMTAYLSLSYVFSATSLYLLQHMSSDDGDRKVGTSLSIHLTIVSIQSML